MVQARVRQIDGVALFLGKAVHGLDGHRLVVIGADVHALDAKPLVYCQEFGR